MLFNSYEFIFLFLPITLVMFYYLGGKGKTNVALYWLVIASLFFYGWWKPAYLFLITGSIVFNYAFGWLLSDARLFGKPSLRRLFLIVGVAVNLTAIGYFKYANFFVDNANVLLGIKYDLGKIILPLAISFFTFQQIAYLVDAYRKETEEHNFLNYALFVTFFPQLIAGPIVHHKEMLPQFMRENIAQLNSGNFAVGTTIFFIGLFKKVIIADGMAGYSDIVFSAASSEQTITFLEAWVGALAYTCQLYFDFSGYSDMAIGLARMFGIRLPLNFNSPYKACNIIEFWRRWHITLSRFLRDYLYYALGGNRKGVARRYTNLLLTMLLGGLWHGAGWTFVLWGMLHGLYLVINHGWQHVRRSLGHDLHESTPWGRVTSRVITFLAVVISWVYFRAENLDVANNILLGMSGANGIVLPIEWAERHTAIAHILALAGIEFQDMRNLGAMFAPLQDVLTILGVAGKMEKISVIHALFALSIPLFIAWFAPNTQQIMIRYKPAFEIVSAEIKPYKWRFVEWNMSRIWAVFIAFIAAYAVFGGTDVNQFLYFNF